MTLTIETRKENYAVFELLCHEIITHGEITKTDSETGLIQGKYKWGSEEVDINLSIIKWNIGSKVEIEIPGQEWYHRGSMEIEKKFLPQIRNSISKLPDKEILEGSMECPFCAEQIRINAKKCKHCHEFLEEIKELQDTDASKAIIDPFAIICFIVGLVGLFIHPFVLVPIGLITSIISWYRLKEPHVSGGGLRITGSILNVINLLYINGYLESFL